MSRTLQDIQRILGVTADGVWGARSQAALDAAIAAAKAPEAQQLHIIDVVREVKDEVQR